MKKVIVGFLVVLGAWWLIQIPRVSDALFLFLTLGVNPFTNRDIPAVVMMELLGGFFLVSVGIIFRKELVKAFRAAHAWRARRAERRQTALEPVATSVHAAPHASLQPLHFDPATGKVLALEPLPTMGDVPTFMHTLQARVQASQAEMPTHPKVSKTKRFTTRVALGTVVLGYWLKVSTLTATTGLRVALRAGVSGSIVAAWHATRMAHQAWRWFRPHAERFDRWLNVTLHQYKTTARALAAGGELEKTLRQLPQQARDLKAKYELADVLRVLRNK